MKGLIAVIGLIAAGALGVLVAGETVGLSVTGAGVGGGVTSFFEALPTVFYAVVLGIGALTFVVVLGVLVARR